MKTITLTSKNQITLPAAMVRKLDLNGSRKLVIQRHGDSLVVTPQKDLAAQMNDIQELAKPYVKKSFTDVELSGAREQAWLARN